MTKNMEESVDSPSHRLNEDNMVQDYTRYCLYKGTPPQIRIAPTENCCHCDRKDTLLHRLAECGDGLYQWEWTKKRLAIHDGYRKNDYSDHTSHFGHRSDNVLYCGCWRNLWGLDSSLSGT